MFITENNLKLIYFISKAVTYQNTYQFNIGRFIYLHNLFRSLVAFHHFPSKRKSLKINYIEQTLQSFNTLNTNEDSNLNKFTNL